VVGGKLDDQWVDPWFYLDEVPLLHEGQQMMNGSSNAEAEVHSVAQNADTSIKVLGRYVNNTKAALVCVHPSFPVPPCKTHTVCVYA
jgi:hypothetical protein